MNPLEGVTLDRLFRPQKDITVLGQTITVRALSSTERSERYKRSMLARARLSAKLNDSNSDDYAIHFSNIADATDDQMREAVLQFRRNEFISKVDKEIPYDFLPIPDGATVDENVEVQIAREAMVKKVDAERATALATSLSDAEETLKKTERKELERQYKQAVRDRILQTVDSEEFVATTIHFSTNKKFSVEDVKEMHETMRDALWVGTQEVDNIDPLRLSGPASTASS